MTEEQLLADLRAAAVAEAQAEETEIAAVKAHVAADIAEAEAFQAHRAAVAVRRGAEERLRRFMIGLPLED